MKESTKAKLKAAILPFAILLLSIFVLSRFASSPQFHAGSLAALEEKQTTVLELTAATTAASAAITLIPGDTAEPIAQKLADLSTGFLLVLCAILLEKYLLTITGYLAFTCLIPGACALYLLNLFLNRSILKELAIKLALFGLAISVVIPASISVSEIIEQTYQTSIEASVEAAKQVSAEIDEGTSSEDAKEDEGFLSGLLSSVTEGISNLTSSAMDWITGAVTRFMETLAIMLVTCCVIPILVLLFFLWLAKAIFGTAISVNYSGIFRKTKDVFHLKKHQKA